MKISVIGAGALGCLFSGLLTEAGEDVLVIARTAEQAETIRRQGVKVTDNQGTRIVHVNISSKPRHGDSSDLVLVAVKAYDTTSASRTAAVISRDDTVLLTLQNGLGNVEALAQHIAPSNIAQGVTTQASTLLDTGSIYHAASGLTVIGGWNHKLLPRLEEVKNVFNRASIATEASAMIDIAIWRKLVVNITINPVSALTGLRNGQILGFEETKMLMKEAVSEAVKVAQAVNVKLPDDIFQTVTLAANVTASNKSSMLQDLERRKKTEVDYLNGAVTQLGKRLGIPTPVNEALTQAVNRTTYTDILRFLQPRDLLRLLPAKLVHTA